MSRSENNPGSSSPVDYVRAIESADFRTLKRKQRGIVFPLSIIFILWYLLYVLLAAYAHDFMSTHVFGNVNVGILMGLGQFVSTFAITTWYVVYSGRHLDPLANKIRESLEREAAGV